MSVELYHGDCLDFLPTLEANSVDTVITDPPAGISFMGKKWDNKTGYVARTDKGRQFLECGELLGLEPWAAGFVAFMIDVLTETYRVMKPGAMYLIWALPRTSDLTGLAMRVAGLQQRDVVTHIFGSGFPKSTSISKQLDKQEQNKWNKISKAVDNLDISAILEIWKKYSSNAKCAELQFIKSQTETGTNTPKSGIALESVMLLVNPEKSSASAIIAELNLSEVLHTPGENTFFAQENVEVIMEQLSENVRFVDKLSGEQKVCLLTTERKNHMTAFTALCNVRELLNEKTTAKLKAVEALRIWLGSKKSLKEETTNALCVALTGDLRRIILNQSKTFQNLDTIQQMDFVSATSVIITESIAELLITYIVNMLKKQAIDKAAGAEREVVGNKLDMPGYHLNGHNSATGAFGHGLGSSTPETRLASALITAPATPAAKTWQGYGTSLKPAVEFWLLGMKPIDGTFANNALTWGVAGLNIDGGRVPTNGLDPNARINKGNGMYKADSIFGASGMGKWTGISGRFPANLILSHHPECVRVGVRKAKGTNIPGKLSTGATMMGTGGHGPRVPFGYADADGFEFVSAYDCHPQCPIRLLGEQSGKGKATQTQQSDGRYLAKQYADTGSGYFGARSPENSYADTGTAARYFLNLEGETRFFYCSKANRRERNEGLDDFYWRKDKSVPFGFVRISQADWGALPEKERAQGNVHSTVKPLKLMEYLCILTRTPTGGVVLDPFVGSGSTGVACVNTGRDFIGIERDAEYFAIAEARIEHAQQQARQLELAL